MNRDSYIRAYMAGALLPVWVLLAVLGFYLLGHVTGRMPAGLERALMFPMAVVPNVWGLWNVLFFRLHCRRFVSIGVFGATLPLLLFPAGLALASALDLNIYTVGRAAIAVPFVMAIYYLAWKFGVAFLNRIVGLA
jgi:hypothetical protein